MPAVNESVENSIQTIDNDAQLIYTFYKLKLINLGLISNKKRQHHAKKNNTKIHA